MKSENAIEVEDLTKDFKVYFDKGNQLKEKLLFKKRTRFEERHVLKGICFEVKKGEAVGLIGHNGCGKSTTLKLLSKIMYPTAGKIEMRGRVSSLIELGAGFHPDMSGRENIYINAAIFGLTRSEIAQRVEDIIAFSELEEFIDNPVRTYSSGMYMRLAFSVAINVDADILLIDEILAVGDTGFQAKCFNRLKEIKASGTTIVIVSHSLGQIEQICDKSLWLNKGEIVAEGAPRDVHPRYLDYMGNNTRENTDKEAKRQKEKKNSQQECKIDETKRWGNGDARIDSVKLFNSDEQETTVFKMNETMEIMVHYKLNKRVENAVIGVSIFRNDGVLCYGTHTRIDGLEDFTLEHSGSIKFKIDSMTLIAGGYTIDFAITSDIVTPVDYYKEAAKFEVTSIRDEMGVVTLKHQWEFL